MIPIVTDPAASLREALVELQPQQQYRSQLQAAHAAAIARARKVCQREPGVVSKYDLGEEIARVELDASEAFGKGDTATYVALCIVARRLQTLIPV